MQSRHKMDKQQQQLRGQLLFFLAGCEAGGSKLSLSNFKGFSDNPLKVHYTCCSRRPLWAQRLFQLKFRVMSAAKDKYDCVHRIQMHSARARDGSAEQWVSKHKGKWLRRQLIQSAVRRKDSFYSKAVSEPAWCIPMTDNEKLSYLRRTPWIPRSRWCRLFWSWATSGGSC